MGDKRYFFLFPFALCYDLITRIRNFLFDKGLLKQEKFRIPVICVGNLTVGGTGKTPHTEYLIRLLKDEFKIAVLSRGYKRKSKGFMIVQSSSTLWEIGDEPLQIYGKFPETIVAVDNDRVNGIKTIMNNYPAVDLVILDDGFQHRWLKPGLSILLTDFNRLITRDYLMPYGRLRENARNRKRADIILVSKSPDTLTEQTKDEITGELKYDPLQRVFFTTTVYKSLKPLFKGNDKQIDIFNLQTKDGWGAVLVTGIANPGSLFNSIKEKFGKVLHLDFPDHYYYSYRDIERIINCWKKLDTKEKILITTEKDAIRLREFANIDDSIKQAFYYIPIEVDISMEQKHEFDNMILDYVRKNKRDSRVSQR